MSDDSDMRHLLDQDFEEIEAKLQNGHASDPTVQGRALALMLRHVRVLVRRNTVTEEECAVRMSKCPGVSCMAPPQKISPWANFATTAIKDAPPWLIIGGYMVAKANGWIQ
jgi:hypothetical protein